MRRISAGIALALALAACTAQREDGVRVLTYASPYSPGHPFSKADIAWMKHVEQASGGTLQIRPQWAGALLSSNQSLIEIRHNVADLGLVTPIYTRGGAHLMRAQSGFYGGVQTMQDQVAIYRCLEASFPQLREEMTGLKLLAVQGGNFPGVVTRDRPVRTLADFRGLRLRVPAELNAVMRKLGADPVDMPMGEVYSAMAKGVIDGVIAPADTFKSLHFGEIARYFSTLHVSRGGYPARAMSLDVWNSLTPAQQRVLEDARPMWEAAILSEIAKAETAGAAFGRESGVQFIPFDPQDQKRFDALYNETALEDARRLSRVGVEGEPVFRRAQALIAGDPKNCTAAPPESAS
jgi:TRAP-type C4-dicarboxylate transport system substrate-binding protein